jgi:hypothetical protein
VVVLLADMLAGKWVELLQVLGTPFAQNPILYHILCPSLCQILFRVLCPIRVHIRLLGSYILELNSLRNILLLFLSWVLRPKVLFYLLLA